MSHETNRRKENGEERISFLLSHVFSRSEGSVMVKLVDNRNDATAIADHCRAAFMSYETNSFLLSPFSCFL